MTYLSCLLGMAALLLAALPGTAQPGRIAPLPATTPLSATATLPPTPAEAVVAASPSPDSIYVNPEVRPRFRGGDAAFSDYLKKNLRFPEQARQRGLSGRVYVRFVLGPEGQVQDAHVSRGPGGGLNEEALRLVWLMPPWEPARVAGRPVRVACTVPISFVTER